MASALSAVLFTAGSATAAIIDFASSAFAGAHGEESFDYTGYGYTFRLDAGPLGSELYQTSEGLGVDAPWGLEDPTEIGLPERLTITFADRYFVEEIYVAQLFRESGWLGTVREAGWYSIDGGPRVDFQASGSSTGLLTLPVGQAANQVEFGVKLVGLTHDYSVSKLNVGAVTAIPEPVSMALLGIGGIVIGAAVRRRI